MCVHVCVCTCVHSIPSDSLPPYDCSPPDSSVHGISQARILRWVAVSFSRGSSQPRDWILISLHYSRFFTTEPPGKPHLTCMVDIILLAQYTKLFTNFIGTNWIVTLLPKLTRKWKKVLVAQSCWTLCDPKDGSPPGSSVHGIVQARILEWITIPVSRGSSQPRDRTQVSCIVGRFFIFWAIAQTLMDNIFSKMKYKYKNFSRWRIWITLGLCLLQSSKFYSQLFIKIAMKSEFLLVFFLTAMTTSSL